MSYPNCRSQIEIITGLTLKKVLFNHTWNMWCVNILNYNVTGFLLFNFIDHRAMTCQIFWVTLSYVLWLCICMFVSTILIKTKIYKAMVHNDCLLLYLLQDKNLLKKKTNNKKTLKTAVWYIRT